MRAKPTQLSVIAVAALAIVAVAAVMLLAGGNPAQATTAENLTPASSGGHLLPMATDPTPTPTPTHATPEPCPADAQVAPTVDSGHIALFDVWWNDDEGELTNTSCPPTVVHVPADPGDEEEERPATPARDDRSPSNINIAKTVIHIPNSARIDLSASDNPYTQDKYPALWDADDLENRDTNGDGTFDGVGDRVVWALPACPPDGSSETVGLCLSFSAALLNSGDWDGNIEYHIDHVHQIDIDKQDPRYTLAYEAYDADSTGENSAIWDSSDAQVAVMRVAAGEYERPMWFFTSRGTYELQVHIRGNPNHPAAPQISGPEPIGVEPSVTSDMREYTIHVGAEADLSVGVEVAPSASAGTSLDPGEDVTITLTASNAGPETAHDTKVDVTLPDGLTYSSHNTATGTYASGVWTIGELAVTNDDENDPITSDDSPTLTITATVAAETHGQDLTVKATISATETVVITESKDGKKVAQEYDVPVLDTEPDNDMATGTITVPRIANVDPMFMVARSVPENSVSGTLVGDPISVMEPNSGDTLTFSLPENGGGKFTVSNVQGSAQIAVANGANLDYETTPSYKLTLAVSDGKDDAGNDDSSTDHTIGVAIEITDVPELTLAVTNTFPLYGNAVTWTASLHPLPADATNVVYHWSMFEKIGNEPASWVDRRETSAQFTWTGVGPYFVDVKMRVSASYTDGNGNSHNVPRVESGWVYWR